MKVLVAYYSLTGNTRVLAQELGHGLGARVEEIRDARLRGKIGTVLRALIDNLLKRDTALATPQHDPADYDVVLIGGPVWGRRIAPPVRAYARHYGARAPRVGFFCTLGGEGAPVAFAELQAACGQAPTATLDVDAMHLPPLLHADAAQRFIDQVRGNGAESPSVPRATAVG